jgi:hypothetical protein
MTEETNSAPVSTLELSPTPAKRSFLKDIAKGFVHVVKTIWTVPAAQGFIATLLIRAGVPATLVTIGIAVGDKLAQ